LLQAAQVLELQDDGNLVLLNATQGVLWQSFDTPTDTLLPGQALRATTNQALVSWRGANDWSEGYYYCAWLQINSSTLYLNLYWNGESIPAWNQSSWSGTTATFSNGTVVYPYLTDYPGTDNVYLYPNGSLYVGNDAAQNSTLVMSSASAKLGLLRRVTLDRDGSLRLYSWTLGTSIAWAVESSWANQPCSVFAECGPYGVCSLAPSSPAYLGYCSCLDGFVPVDPNDPLKGCKRKFEIPPGVCATNTTKLEMRLVGEIDFPFASRLYPFVNTTEQGCISLCYNDCRCMGAVFWRREGLCFVKGEPMFNGGWPQDVGNHSSYLKELSSPLYLPSDRGKMELIVGSVAAGAMLVCLGTAFGVWIYWKRRRLQVQAMFADHLMCPRKFTLRELSAATKNFSESELIGRGGMGSVFKGTLKPTGTVVAVKRIRHESRGGEQGFLAEASSISQIRHRNLVQLKGWCIDDGKFLLVYNYMPNGSLDQWLYDGRSEASRRRQRTGKPLSWNLRYSILTGIAAALAYLHEDWQQCVLHRDIKSSNVLLNAEFDAYLGDFGLARLIDHQKMEKTTLMAGTLAYMAPEMPYTGKATKETDIYSFGVLILEVVCGQRPVDSFGDLDPEDVVLLHRVWRAHEDNNLLSTVDPRLRTTPQQSARNGHSKDDPDYDADADFTGALTRRIEEERLRETEQKKLALKLGLLCCLPNPSARPSMRLAHQILTGDVTTLPPLPATNQWSHLDVLDAFRIGFHPEPVQESESFSSSPSTSLQLPDDVI
jgi:serine/threonine protein kinase